MTPQDAAKRLAAISHEISSISTLAYSSWRDLPEYNQGGIAVSLDAASHATWVAALELDNDVKDPGEQL